MDLNLNPEVVVLPPHLLCLPEHWRNDLIAYADAHGKDVKISGRGPGSLEPEDTAGLDYRVTTGDALQDLDWLQKVYREVIPSLAYEIAGLHLEPDPHLSSTININFLRGRKARYEWHVDGNTWTALLFASDTQGDGALVAQVGKGDMFFVPQAGTAVLFNGHRIPHTVLPLRNTLTRLSVPMSYYLQGEDPTRTQDADGYLYKTGG